MTDRQKILFYSAVPFLVLSFGVVVFFQLKTHTLVVGDMIQRITALEETVKAHGNRLDIRDSAAEYWIPRIQTMEKNLSFIIDLQKGIIKRQREISDEYTRILKKN